MLFHLDRLAEYILGGDRSPGGDLSEEGQIHSAKDLPRVNHRVYR
jgi:hypothetical protein